MVGFPKGNFLLQCGTETHLRQARRQLMPTVAPRTIKVARFTWALQYSLTLAHRMRSSQLQTWVTTSFASQHRPKRKSDNLPPGLCTPLALLREAPHTLQRPCPGHQRALLHRRKGRRANRLGSGLQFLARPCWLTLNLSLKRDGHDR